MSLTAPYRLQITLRNVDSALQSSRLKVLTKFTKLFPFLPLKHRFKMETVFLSASSLCSLFSWKWDIFKLASSFLCLPAPRSHPLVSSMAAVEVGNGLLVPSWEVRKGPEKVLNGRTYLSCLCPSP